MKIKAVLGIMLTLLLAIVLIFAFNIQPVEKGTTIIVPDDYERIQWAIGNSSDGDIIFVRAGTYYEQVIVNKTVSLIGENPNTTIIEGEKFETIVEVQANNVEISGFKFYNGEFGVYINGYENNTIRNCMITKEVVTGILLSSSHRNIIEDNIISRGTLGLKLHHSYKNIIKKNLISNNNYGIDISGSVFQPHDNHLIGNVLAENSKALSLVFSRNNKLRNNTLVNNTKNFIVYDGFDEDIDPSNTIDGKPIYYLVNQNNLEVPVDAAFIALVDCVNITIRNQMLVNNSLGILLKNTRDSTIENVTVKNNDWGILIDESTNNIVSNCTILSNEILGIYILSSTDNTFVKNVISEDGRGVWFSASSHNTIANCELSRNWCGIYLHKSENNLIYHNNLIENSDGPIRTAGGGSGSNTWDDGYPSGGNYWSDYVDRYPDAEELNGSGIWDTPYFIDDYNQDNYPLMNPC